MAETGTICVLESEGNGRMCLTLPQTLITVMGIEKLLPTFQDFEVFLQLLPRSSTGERMNPYTSLWTGVTPGDGPQAFHLVLLDNGRTKVLADEVGRQTLHCIRCSACLNICPVYARTGGHAYGSVYPGPIGAILDTTVARTGPCQDAALRLHAVWRLLRGLPGADQHPRSTAPSARRSHPACQRPRPRGGGDAPVGHASSPALSATSEHNVWDAWGSVSSSATVSSIICQVCWRAGPVRATCSPSPTKPSATGGANANEAKGRARLKVSREATKPWLRGQPAKDTILARIHAALAKAPAPESAPPRAYRQQDERDPAAISDELVERLREYKAQVERVAPATLPTAIAAACAQYGIRRLVIPTDIPEEWLPAGIEALRDDPPLTHEQLDQSDGVLTGCALAIAQTGTIVLDGGAHQGRRALSLVPDCHLCVVYTEQVVGIVPEGIPRLAGAPTRPITLISGPSATSDIELSRVEGVHGPRMLYVFLVDQH